MTERDWDGSHPPPACAVAERCGCDESKLLRAIITAAAQAILLADTPAARVELAEAMVRECNR